MHKRKKAVAVKDATACFFDWLHPQKPGSLRGGFPPDRPLPIGETAHPYPYFPAQCSLAPSRRRFLLMDLAPALSGLERALTGWQAVRNHLTERKVDADLCCCTRVGWDATIDHLSYCEYFLSKNDKKLLTSIMLCGKILTVRARDTSPGAGRPEENCPAGGFRRPKYSKRNGKTDPLPNFNHNHSSDIDGGKNHEQSQRSKASQVRQDCHPHH